VTLIVTVTLPACCSATHNVLPSSDCPALILPDGPFTEACPGPTQEAIPIG
jgi:hypothetical protein